jgi:hypothetical protein
VKTVILLLLTSLLSVEGEVLEMEGVVVHQQRSSIMRLT